MCSGVTCRSVLYFCQARKHTKTHIYGFKMKLSLLSNFNIRKIKLLKFSLQQIYIEYQCFGRNNLKGRYKI